MPFFFFFWLKNYLIVKIINTKSGFIKTRALSNALIFVICRSKIKKYAIYAWQICALRIITQYSMCIRQNLGKCLKNNFGGIRFYQKLNFIKNWTSLWIVFTDSDKIKRIRLFRAGLIGYIRMQHHCKNSLAIKRKWTSLILLFIFPGASSPIYWKTSSGNP